MIKFTHKISQKSTIHIIIKMLIVAVTWNLCMVWIISLFSDAQHLAYTDSIYKHSIGSWMKFFLYIVPIRAIGEEIIFRTLPILIMILSIRWFKKEQSIIIGIMLLSNSIFGILHGSYLNILMQGVIGCILFYSFLIGYTKKQASFHSISLKGLGLGTIITSCIHISFNWIMIGIKLL